MIVEFIGSTGAGKTTLITQVQHRLAQETNVTSSFAVVASLLGLGSISHPTARNLIQELAGLPFLLRSLSRHRAFLLFMWRMIRRQASFSIFTVNILRSLARKIAVYEIIKSRQQNQIVMVDEGTILLAHNVFVYSDAKYTSEEIAMFASLVPLPDIIVYIKAPIDALVQRSLQRADPPREIRSKNPALVETSIHRAVQIFDQLSQADPIRRRLLVVENPHSDHQHTADVVEHITRYILNQKVGNIYG
jgi:thymidylate kinase